MGKYAKVQGQPGLVRNKHSNAIINMNSSSMDQARKRKQAWREEQKKNEVVASEIDTLKSDVQEIKSLLKQILEVSNGSNSN